jgi:hypothetical protein
MNMKRFMNKKVAAIGLAAGLALGGAGAAFAYFTSTGSGPGSASVGSASTLTVTQTGSISGLTPGSGAVPFTYTITDPTADGGQNLGIVSATNLVITQALGAVGSCTSADFTLTPAGSAVGSIVAGATYTSVTATEPTIAMNETGVNQDGCENATIAVTLSAASGS